ncbi:MAG: twin-arginine translocation signal domain-containing protein, partial [Actinobacteria bacterium]|nr:twin-arginine translocation signal domain-containing protein [Actinomycetota bacterium]
MPIPLSRRDFLGATTLVATAIATGNHLASAKNTGAQLPTPTGSLVTRWDTDRWSLGAYSALPVGSAATVRQTLARAIVNNRLVFAGEYTDPDYPATVQGALRSGQRAARALIANGSGP